MSWKQILLISLIAILLIIVMIFYYDRYLLPTGIVNYRITLGEGHNYTTEDYKNIIDILLRIAILGIIFFGIAGQWISNQLRKAGESQEILTNELLRIDAENFKLELESLRAQYFDHAFSGVFKYLRILIDEGRMSKDEHKLESAITVTNKLSRLFSNISRDRKSVV